MLIFFQELMLQLFLWLLKMIDGIMSIFSALSGVMKVTYKGQQVNILEFITGDSTVGIIFWCIFIFAVGLSCIFGIAALVKNMITNNRQVSTIVGKLGLSVLGTMAMLAVVILGILISNSILMLFAEIFQIGNTTKLSNALFNACVGDWLNGYTVAEIDVSALSVRDIFGDYNATVFGIWPTSWKNNGMVNPDTFLYLPAMIASIGLAIALVIAAVNLAKRVYEIVFLYLAMPLSMSTLSVDDGARFKVWRETFITKIVLAYGAVFSVNIFILLLPLITPMCIEGVNKFGNSIFLLFMILGGAMVIPAGQTLFARLFGSADDMRISGGFLRTAFYGSRFASLAAIGLAGKVLRGTAHVGKKIITHKTKADAGDERYSESRSSSETGSATSTEGESVSDSGETDSDES